MPICVEFEFLLAPLSAVPKKAPDFDGYLPRIPISSPHPRVTRRVGYETVCWFCGGVPRGAGIGFGNSMEGAVNREARRGGGCYCTWHRNFKDMPARFPRAHLYACGTQREGTLERPQIILCHCARWRCARRCSCHR